MSVRIYQLSKQLNLENKELIAILQKRGLDVKSASNTIPNIYADSLIEEYKNKTSQPEATGSAVTTATAEPVKAEVEPAKAAPIKTQLPAGKLVKSKADIVEEKKALEESKAKPSTVVKSAIIPAKPPARPSIGPKAPSLPQRQPAAPTRPTNRAPLPPRVPAMGNRPKAPGLPPPMGGFKRQAPVASTAPKVQPIPTTARIEITESGVKKIHCKPPIVVRDFANMIEVKPFKLISELMEMGIFASMNQAIEENTAVKLAQKHGYELEVHHRGEQKAEVKKEKVKEPEADDPKFLKPRPPVVCVLGHVDHGKTSLLDVIRKANVVSGEAGGITQHVGAYQIEHNKHKITFIDTPGHAAFSKMRERGANVTDIAILVVAADDGFKPQTEEALKFAQNANVPIVVAINKIDTKGANVERVKQQMQEKGISPEDWGGETLTTPISAKTKAGIDDLLSSILLQAEVAELKANPDCPAQGVIIESQMEMGRGPTGSVIIEKGTLKPGAALVCGNVTCKVKAMLDEHGKQVKSAPPATPVKIIGWSKPPKAGSSFLVVKNEKIAKKMAEENEINSNAEAADAKASRKKRMTIDDLLAAIDVTQEKTFKVVVKSDVAGTVEALAGCLEDIKSEKITLEIIGSGVGSISKSDITLANASNAVIVGFNVQLETGAAALAKQNNVLMVQHDIIYELIDRVKDEMADQLDPELREVKLGAAEIRQIFGAGKGKSVAGCMVTEGLIQRDMYARLRRGKNIITENTKVTTLKRFKDDAAEVRAGYECGINLRDFNDYQEKDVIECYKIDKVRAAL